VQNKSNVDSDELFGCSVFAGNVPQLSDVQDLDDLVQTILIFDDGFLETTPMRSDPVDFLCGENPGSTFLRSLTEERIQRGLKRRVGIQTDWLC